MPDDEPQICTFGPRLHLFLPSTGRGLAGGASNGALETSTPASASPEQAAAQARRNSWPASPRAGTHPAWSLRGPPGLGSSYRSSRPFLFSLWLLAVPIPHQRPLSMQRPLLDALRPVAFFPLRN